MIHRQVGQHLAVEVDACLLQFPHKFRIREAVFAHPGIDPLNPNPPEFSFLLFSVSVSIHQPLLDGIFRYSPYILLAAKETFSQLHDALTLSPGGYVVY